MHRVTWYMMALVAGLIGTSAGAAVLQPIGPDSFGYQGDTVASNLRDISGTGTSLPLGDETMSGAISLGFDFEFYGTTFSAVHVAANGFLDFDGGSASIRLPQAIPVAASGGRIGGFLRDQNPAAGGTIAYEMRGAAGSQEFVVGFYSVPSFGTSDFATFEMILHESGHIEFQYGDITDSRPGEASVGIESPDGTAGLSLLFGDAPSSNFGYCISVGAVPEVCGDVAPSVVPLPGSSSFMMALGAVGAGLHVRRRRRAAPARRA
ncbi:MAG: hypothetical protein AAGB05_17340 [Pseudomonadota bacterium]